MWISLDLSCLVFVQLFESVRLYYVMFSLGSIQPLFLPVLFSSALFLLFFQDSPKGPWGSVLYFFFLCFILFLLFQLSNFYHFMFQFTDSLSPLFCCWAHSLSFLFWLLHLSILIHPFGFLWLPFLRCAFIVAHVLRVFLSTHWSIFIVAALKSFSDNFCLLSGGIHWLTFFFIQFEIFLFFGMKSDFFIETQTFSYYIKRFGILFNLLC